MATTIVSIEDRFEEDATYREVVTSDTNEIFELRRLADRAKLNVRSRKADSFESTVRWLEEIADTTPEER